MVGKYELGSVVSLLFRLIKNWAQSVPLSLQCLAMEAVIADFPHPGSPVSQKKFGEPGKMELAHSLTAASSSILVPSSHGFLPCSS